jgi:hypothetical protein
MAIISVVVPFRLGRLDGVRTQCADARHIGGALVIWCTNQWLAL